MKSVSYLFSTILIAIIGNVASMDLDAASVKRVAASWEKVKKVDNYEKLVRESFYTHLFAHLKVSHIFPEHSEMNQELLDDKEFEAEGLKFVQGVNKSVEIVRENEGSDASPAVEKIRNSNLFGYTEVAYFHQVKDALMTSLDDLLGDEFTVEDKESWVSVTHSLAKSFSNTLDFGDIKIAEL